MAQRNDQIFQLSLTEIAFTLAFLLLLLLGYVVVKEQTERLAAEAALAKVQAAEVATAALDAAKNALEATLRASGASNPDEVITQLVSAQAIAEERNRLRQRVEDLDAQLTALSELRNDLEKVAKSKHPDRTAEAIESALVIQANVRKALDPEVTENPVPSSSMQPDPAAAAKEREFSRQRDKRAVEQVKQAIVTTAVLRKELEHQLKKDLQVGHEARTVQEVVFAARRFGELEASGASIDAAKKENADLRGQVAFLKNRLDARGGRDFPPCWADERGKVQFLFSVENRPDSIAVTPAWPASREAVALALPGVAQALAGAQSHQSFTSNVQSILDWSKRQDPECRHYVQLKSSIADAVQSDRARLMVERFFYKVEVRR